MTTSASRAAAVAETHSAVVFFLGDRAYKAKKPVDLGFLDFTSLASRRVACHREVELNRRLSPDVYLGVADVTAPDGETCEHLVVMRRMPDDRRLSLLAAGDAELDGPIREIAERMAAFHGAAGAPPVAATSASAPMLEARWRQLVTSVGFYGREDLARQANVILGAACRYLSGRSALFEERIAAGRARDGHGDLLADDIFLLGDGVRILDCLDFDESLRCGDVLADVAFLAMDLERLGRRDLAATLLEHYRSTTGDEWPASLAHHYVAQRALVRASVALIRAAQGDARAGATADELLDLSRRHLDAGAVRLVVVGGLPGTGKSTVAAGMADRADAVLLRSDEVRQSVAPSGDDRYGSRAVDRTYGELMARAAYLLARGRSVILDATWRSPCHRLAAEGLARATSANLVILECDAPSSVADRRIEARRSAGGDPSEATAEVARILRSTWQPWQGAVRVDTTGSIEESVAAAMAVITSAEERLDA